MLPYTDFSYPKSIYAVLDSLRFIVGDNPNALIVDFFAGSGTTILAAKQEGYPAVGIELSAHYANVAAKRIADDAEPAAAA